MNLFKRMAKAMLVTTIAMAFSVSASAQLRTEMRDSVRGVSFYSVEISDDRIVDLNVLQGSFPDSDRLAIGLSVMLFDGASTPEEFILWIRHQGRRWLDFDPAAGSPVQMVVDGKVLSLDPVRAPQPFIGESGRMFEKIELQISEQQFRQLVTSKEAMVQLRALNGDVDKLLSAEELAYMSSFRSRL